MLKAILISLRPYQWVKNVLVFAALLFSLSFLNLEAVLLAIKAFLSFCLVSSSVYLMNDIQDRKVDRLHAVKRNRPIASGELPVPAALFCALLLCVGGMWMAYAVNLKFISVIAAYLLLNIGYSMGLKQVVLLDVMIIALGFLLRAIAGAFAIDVAVSPWLFICTLLLALLLIFGKRRHELALMELEAANHRKSLADYTLPFIDGLMFVSAGAAIVTYSLYTMAEETIARFETQWLIITTPLAIYGIFRYLYLIYVKKDGGDPTRIMIKDKPFIINALIWLLVIMFIIYRSKVAV